MAEKYVYYFGNGKAEGSAAMKSTLGGKGANLAEMTSIDVPVPPGFTVSTDVCAYFYDHDKNYPASLEGEVKSTLERLESEMGKKLGDPKDPLLVSVRSGAAVSMPGMMDTVLNLGLNDEAVVGLAESAGNDRFAWDSYRRFINMFGDVVMGMEHEHFEEQLSAVKSARGVDVDTDLTTEDLKEVVQRYKKVYQEHTGASFPQDPMEQLWAAINAVFGSWNSDRAIKYRRMSDIRGLKGTAVNVQSMVFGNFGETSGTGVCFSRDPSTGEKIFYGEYLINAQGEDVVAGIRTPLPISALQRDNQKLYDQLVSVKDRLEKHYRDMQDMEFTIQEGNLFLLQTRNGKRTGAAAVRIAVEMVEEGLLDKEASVASVSPELLDQVFHPRITPAAKKSNTPIATGLNASPGAACGQATFTADDAEAWVAQGKKVILVRRETSPEDIGGMNAAEGILTSTGGMTSHAAVVARGMGTPCVAGATALSILDKKITVGDIVIQEGDELTIDGTTGEIYRGRLEVEESTITDQLQTFLGWADEIRKSGKRDNIKQIGIQVRTNADTPDDAKRAREFGAEGIGLCRTEHMFFEEGRILPFRKMIVAKNPEARKRALADLLPLQEGDFAGIFRAMDGLPVTIRLLDPPLHEFVPHDQKGVVELAKAVNIEVDELNAKIAGLHEFNPMLGHRGCRLGISYPEIYIMQVEAIISAALTVQKEGIKVLPEIMIPLVGTVKELKIMRADAVEAAERTQRERGEKVEYLVGTMIEIPRAALTADEVATEADFFSFGTNDLTQMAFGFSRDDTGSFLPKYLENDILDYDPFAVLDQSGVGQLVQIGTERGRQTKPDLKVGICGEHGGEPASVDFCYRMGMNYVSCSPFRVPIARLSAAQAVLKARK